MTETLFQFLEHIQPYLLGNASSWNVCLGSASIWLALATHVVSLVGHDIVPAGSSFTPRATIRSDPSGSGRCSFRASSGDAVIQVSTSSRVVSTTGIAFGWIAPTSAFGSVVRNA